MRKKERHSNFLGDNYGGDFMAVWVITGIATFYFLSKGVGKITKSKNNLRNTALVIGGLIVYTKIKANQPED